MEMVLARMRQPAAKADDDEKHQRNTERNEGTERSQDGMAAVPSPARKQQKSGADDDDEESEDSDTMLVEAAAAEEENAAVVQDGGAASDDDGDDDDDDDGEVPEMRGSFPRVTCVAPKPFQGYGDDTTKFLAKFGLARAAPAQNTKARKGPTLNGNKLGRGPSKHKAGGRKGDPKLETLLKRPGEHPEESELHGRRGAALVQGLPLQRRRSAHFHQSPQSTRTPRAHATR